MLITFKAVLPLGNLIAKLTPNALVNPTPYVSFKITV